MGTVLIVVGLAVVLVLALLAFMSRIYRKVGARSRAHLVSLLS